MTVAVVTTAAGRPAHLDRLLAGVAGSARRPDDVVVVDLRPADPTVRDVVTAHAGARCVAGPTTGSGALALAAGRNAGAAATDCERLVFLDVDCIPAPDLVGAYGAALTEHPGGLACGPVRYLREGWADGGDPLDATSLQERSDAPAARPRPAEPRVGDEHDLFWSLSFGVTAATWAAIGGFDEGYVGYGAEDTDFAWRARALGVPLVWLAGGVAFHQWHPPSRFDPDRLDEMIANARRFHRRWGRWPMAGWFDDLARARLVRFEPEGGVLERVP